MKKKTDSCIISLDAWYRYGLDKIKDVDLKIKHEQLHAVEYVDVDDFGDPIKPRRAMERVDDETDYSFYDDEVVKMKKLINPLKIIPQEGVRYSIINIISHCLGNIVNDYMERYTKNSNSYKEGKECLINMKNEFLFKRIYLMAVKKNYVSIQELQEGNVIKGGAMDIKGLQMQKSVTNKRTQKALRDIMFEDIMNAGDNIDQVKLLKDLAKFEKEIIQSLKDGNKDLYKPCKIKSMRAYDNPMSTFGIKQAIAWNALKEDGVEGIDLSLSNAFDIAKVLITPKNRDIIKDTYPEVYSKLVELMNQKGFDAKIEGIAIPRNAQVPSWLLEFLDYTSITNDNLKLFPIEQLGIFRGNNNNNYTNILSL